jgi:hypothetical protein
MTAEQSLVGAMGCASWRAHDRVREYIDLAPAGGLIRGGPRNGPSTTQPSALGLNEVGVTDSVLTTLWHFGPRAASFAVSAGAEANHLGADIAIVHSSTKRVLLYQAKLARLDTVRHQYEMKSKVPIGQARLLRRKSVTLGGVRHRMTGRLALYQADSTPFISHCHHRFGMHPPWWPMGPALSSFVPDPTVGRDYYRHVLAGCGCSSSGVLAAPVASSPTISTIPDSQTWPWEFDTYEWLHGSSRLDRGDDLAVDNQWSTLESPVFEEYRPASGPEIDGAEDLANELALRLRMTTTQMLYVILI